MIINILILILTLSTIGCSGVPKNIPAERKPEWVRKDDTASIKNSSKKVLESKTPIGRKQVFRQETVIPENKAKKIEKFPKDLFLTIISSDYTKKTYSLFVNINKENQILSIKTRNDQKNKIKTYATDVLEKEIVLVKALGAKIVTLSCQNFHRDKGCDVYIKYPENITYGNFKSFKAKLTKVKSKWRLVSNNKPFTKMNLVSKKFVGLLIGIKTIQLEN